MPHHLIDMLEPDGGYSAARFRADALAAVAEILARGRLPLLVGGTMLYFRALAPGHRRAAAPQTRDARRDRPRGGARGLAGAARRAPAWIRSGRAASSPRRPAHPARARGLPRDGTGRCRSCAPRAAARCPVRALPAARSMPARPRRRCTAHRRALRAMLAAGLVEELRALRARRRLAATLPCMRSRRLPAGVGLARGPLPAGERECARHRGHPPARQAPAHLAARDGRARALRLPARGRGAGGGGARRALPQRSEWYLKLSLSFAR